ncbi:hypothetical protein [Marinobacter sp. MMG032]|uniref:Uncharacterized protein n=1 Tax=Marinobacter sp. MMG032 TaxID=3158548 RepID=A0AAU7MLH4_9GAMM
MLFPRSILSVIVVLALSGCGGGSGGSSGPVEAPPATEPTPAPSVPSVSLNQVFVQAAEGEILKLPGQFRQPDSVTLSQSPDIGLEVESFQANEISLRVPVVDRPSASDLQLTFVYGDQSIEQRVSLLAQNTSGEALVAQVQDTLRERESILELAQDFSLYRFFIDYAYLYDLVTYSEKEQRLSEFLALDSPSRATVYSAIEGLGAAFNDYQAGQIADQALNQALGLAEQAILEHGRYGARMLEEIQPLVEILVPELSSGDLVYVPELGIYSRIASTPLYGDVTEAGFEVAQSFRPIESLIRSRKTQSLTCESL